MAVTSSGSSKVSRCETTACSARNKDGFLARPTRPWWALPFWCAHLSRERLAFRSIFSSKFQKNLFSKTVGISPTVLRNQGSPGKPDKWRNLKRFTVFVSDVSLFMSFHGFKIVKAIDFSRLRRWGRGMQGGNNRCYSTNQ